MKVSVIIPVYNSENTIRATLDSILNQKDAEIEVICVDDCSTDQSVSVIKDVAEADDRIKLLLSESNQGVAHARNKGLACASGEYIRFCDADDLLPADSTNKMLSVAIKNDSDIVAGIMEGSRGARSFKYAPTPAIAKKEVIDKYDPLLTRSFSVCNKMFKTDIIHEHNLEFKPFKHAEDGMFLFEFLQYANMINGCDSVVYTYCRPSTYKGSSVTVNLTDDTLCSLLEVADSILEMHSEAPAEFKDAFNARILSTTLIDKYYTKLWRLDDAALVTLKNAMLEYRDRIQADVWDDIVDSHPDLLLDKMIFSRDEAVDNALLTVAVSDDLDADSLNDLLGSLYFQKSPFFDIFCFAPEEKVSDELKSMPNLHFIGNDGDFYNKSLELCTSPYICFINDPIMFSFDSLTKALNILMQNSETGYVSGLCQRFKDDDLITPAPYKLAFKNGTDGIYKECSEADRIDALLSNKIFRTDVLRRLASEGIDPIHTPASELASVIPHGRYKKIKYIIGYSDEELRSHLSLPEKKQKKTLFKFLRKLAGQVKR